MAASDRRVRKREARRERVVAAAAALVARDGIETFSIHAVARELDAAPAGLYHYFPSKGALLAAVQERGFTRFGEDFAAVDADWRDVLWPGEAIASDDPEGLLTLALAMVRYYLSLPVRRPELARLTAFSLDPRTWLDEESAEATRIGPVLVETFRPLGRLFGELRAAGVLSEGATVPRAITYWASVHGIGQTAKLERFAPGLFGSTLERTLDAAGALLRGWGASEDLVERARARAAELPLSGAP